MLYLTTSIKRNLLRIPVRLLMFMLPVRLFAIVETESAHKLIILHLWTLVSTCFAILDSIFMLLLPVEDFFLQYAWDYFVDKTWPAPKAYLLYLRHLSLTKCLFKVSILFQYLCNNFIGWKSKQSMYSTILNKRTVPIKSIVRNFLKNLTNV